jgi:hypothetical protein
MYKSCTARAAKIGKVMDVIVKLLPHYPTPLVMME